MAFYSSSQNTDRVRQLEKQLAESRQHVQELQEMLSDEQASQSEWRNYAEAKNLEAAAALECVDTLKQEQNVMEEYITDVEAENAALKQYMDSMQEQLLSLGGSPLPEVVTPKPSPRPIRDPASVDRLSSASKALLTTPSASAVEHLQNQVAKFQEEVADLQAQLCESQDNVDFLRKQLGVQQDQAVSKVESSGKYRQTLVSLESTLHAASSPTADQGHPNGTAVDGNAIRGELWKYVNVLEDEKAQLIAEVEELQASWVAAESRCTTLQAKVDELESTLQEAMAKEDLLQKTNRRLEAVLAMVSREHDVDVGDSGSEDLLRSPQSTPARPAALALTPISAHRISLSESLTGDWQTPLHSPSQPTHSDPDLMALTKELDAKFGGIASVAHALLSSTSTPSKDSKDHLTTPPVSSSSGSRDTASMQPQNPSTPDLLKESNPQLSDSGSLDMGQSRPDHSRKFLHSNSKADSDASTLADNR